MFRRILSSLSTLGLISPEDAAVALITSVHRRGPIAANGPLLNHLATDGELLRVLLTRDDAWGNGVISNEAVLSNLANNPDVLSALLSMPQTRAWILSQPEILGRFVASPEAVAQLVKYPDALDRVIASAELQQRILETPELLAGVISSERARTFMLTQPGVLDPLVNSSEAAARLVKFPEALDALLRSQQARRRLLLIPELLREVVLSDQARNFILSQPGLLDPIVTSPEAAARLIKFPDAVDALLNMPPVRRRIAAFPEILRDALASEAAQSLILTHHGVLDRIVTTPEAAARLIKFPDAVDALLTMAPVRRRIAALPEILRDALASEAAQTLILTHFGILDTIVTSPEAQARLVKFPAMLRKVLRSPEAERSILEDEDLVPRMLADFRFARNTKANARSAAIIEFQNIWHRLKPFVDTTAPDLNDRFTAVQNTLTDRHEVSSAIVRLLTVDGRLRLAHGALRVPDDRAAWCLINEILLNESYYFESQTPRPRIVDAGAHMGFSIYYFKTLFPNCEITAFEPVPALRGIAQENIRACGFTDVTVEPYALAAQEGTQTLTQPSTDSMAGSLGHDRTDGHAAFDVQTVPLSRYLVAPVDCLKMDIEGSEYEVLDESKHLLNNVHHFFCELHHVSAKNDRLTHVLTLLSSAGFDYWIAPSWADQLVTERRTMQYAGRPQSLSLWAKNRRPPKT